MFNSAVSRRARRARISFLIALASIAAIAALAPTAQAVSPDGDPFYTTPELCKLTLSPATVDVVVGGSQTLTAKLESTGVMPELGSDEVPVQTHCYNPNWAYTSAVSNGVLSVNFNLLSGPNAPQTANQPLGEGDVATHTYSSLLAGTDTWNASIELPAVCHLVNWGELEAWDGMPVPPECVNRVECVDEAGNLDYDCGNDEEIVLCENQGQGDNYCDDSVVSSQYPPQEPTVTLNSNNSAVTWYTPQVEIQRDPTVSVSTAKKCHTPNKFRVRPSAANGQVSSMTIYVDGKKVKKVTGSAEAFTIDGKKYGPGSHSIKLVTSFTNGKTVTTTTTFSRCKARTVAKRTKPKFTG